MENPKSQILNPKCFDKSFDRLRMASKAEPLSIPSPVEGQISNSKKENKKTKYFIGLAILLIVLLVSIAVAVTAGSIFVDPFSNMTATQSLIFWQIRLPRILMAALVGAMLAVSGAVLQGVLRNPLSDPYILGVSAGGGLGAAIAIIFSLPFISVSLFAFSFSLIAVFAVYQISKTSGRIDPGTLILSGVAVSSFVSAVLGFLIITSNKLESIYFWMLGSFSGAVWQNVWIASICAVIGTVLSYLFAGKINALLLGEEEALSLGIEIDLLRGILLAVTSLMAGISVAMCGMIGFAGLIVPHIIRMFGFSNYKYLIPMSAVCGAILMVLSDLIARTVIMPAEVPVGIITALTGAPFFIYLLRKRI